MKTTFRSAFLAILSFCFALVACSASTETLGERSDAVLPIDNQPGDGGGYAQCPQGSMPVSSCMLSSPVDLTGCPCRCQSRIGFLAFYRGPSLYVCRL